MFTRQENGGKEATEYESLHRMSTGSIVNAALQYSISGPQQTPKSLAIIYFNINIGKFLEEASWRSGLEWPC